MLAEKNNDIRKAKKVLEHISKDQQARMAYDAREKQLRDEATRLADAKSEGIEQGLQQGLQQGVERTKILMVKDLLRFKVDRKIIMETSGLTEEEIQQIEYSDKKTQ